MIMACSAEQVQLPHAPKKPFLVLIGGLPGTGKTTLAKKLAHRLRAQHLNSDILRDRLHKRGQYDEFTKQTIYDALVWATRNYLRAGRPVVVDATFYKRALRAPFVQMAQQLGIPVAWILLTAPEEVVAARVSQKRPYSEADFSVYRKVKQDFEPLDTPHLVLNTCTTADALLFQALQFVYETLS